MKFLAAGMALVASGCGPYRIAHEHIELREIPDLVVTERAAADPDDSKSMQRRTVGLPVRSTLTRDGYRIDFHMPLSTQPLLFFSVRSPDGKVLVSEGAHVRRVAHRSAEEYEGYVYSFYVREARGKPLELVIRGTDGREIARERLRYRIRTRGVEYGIEWI